MRSSVTFPRVIWPAVTIGAVLAAMQWAGGAWTAEFNGYPDETAHFITGRMLWEYARTLPREDPLAWAGQYYLHYPKVGLGHWPPGYHLLEAGWFLLFGPSRLSAMGLQWLLGVAALTVLYALVRPALQPAVAAAVVVLTAATPIFQQGLEQTMSELGCLLCSVLLMHAVVRLVRNPDRAAVYWVSACLGASAMMKGSAACLVPVPLLALLLAGKRPTREVWRPVAISILVLTVCAGWYIATSNVIYWGGFTTRSPWPVRLIGAVAGWGFLALAVVALTLAGRWRDPLALVAASLITSTVLVSYAVRAMNEPRHWILVLPSVLVLAGYTLTQAPRLVAAPLFVVSLWFFPWAWYRQAPAGFREVIAQLRLPARILISAGKGSDGEGGMIAETSIADGHAASTVARASKVLARSSWNGENYKLLAQTTGDVTKRLDELAIGVVVLDRPGEEMPPHHVLLGLTVRANPAWRQCGASEEVVAYCRLVAPAYPRKPLEVDAGGRHFVER